MLNLDLGNFHSIVYFIKNFSKRRLVVLSLFCGEVTCDFVKSPYLSQRVRLCLFLSQEWLNGNPFSEKLAQSTIDEIFGQGSSESLIPTYPSLNALRLVLLREMPEIDPYYAAHTVRYASQISNEAHDKILPYLDALTKDIPKTPYIDPFEIIVYLQDQLEYPILDGNRLNLWNKQYEYQIIGSIAEIANTVGIRNLLNA